MNKLKTKHGLLHTRYGFTLVELIVVIVILAILASIAFINLQDYPKSARDIVRKTDLRNIAEALELHKIKNIDFPTPDNTGATEDRWIPGEFGTGVYNLTKGIDTLPVDPVTKENYTYALTEDGNTIKLTAQLENGETYTIIKGPGNAGNISESVSHTPATSTVTSIQKPNTLVTFEDHSTETLDGVTGYYTQSNTNLKWEANPIGAYKWTNCSDATDCQNYGEPTWDGINYKDPGDNSIIDGENTKYPAFAHCVKKGPGWRLPTKNEFWSIMTDTATEKNAYGYFTLLPSVSTHSYWSSTEYAYNTTSAWIPFFDNGSMYISTKSGSHSILCIHD